MKRFNVLFLLLVLSTFVLSGCVVRTYQATKDRVDQDLTGGNRGYLMANAPQYNDQARKSTRTTQVVEIELHPPFKFEKSKKGAAPVQEQAVYEESMDTGFAESVEPEMEAVGSEQYTVQKNDTLQKISQKFYGTTKKWMKIFEANKETLKSPDKIRPGQTINIPKIDSPSVKPAGYLK